VVSATTAAIVVLGGTAVWRLERDRSGSNLRTWGDALWWSITTITTVGYGEHYQATGG
jgi:voltage-gated potassium channel